MNKPTHIPPGGLTPIQRICWRLDELVDRLEKDRQSVYAYTQDEDERWEAIQKLDLAQMALEEALAIREREERAARSRAVAVNAEAYRIIRKLQDGAQTVEAELLENT